MGNVPIDVEVGGQGVGRVYLAFCPAQERDAIIQLLRKSDLSGEPLEIRKIEV